MPVQISNLDLNSQIKFSFKLGLKNIYIFLIQPIKLTCVQNTYEEKKKNALFIICFSQANNNHWKKRQEIPLNFPIKPIIYMDKFWLHSIFYRKKSLQLALVFTKWVLVSPRNIKGLKLYKSQCDQQLTDFLRKMMFAVKSYYIASFINLNP